MVDVKDPAIRLFGRTIQLAPNDDVSACYSTGSVSFQSTSDNKNPADAINPVDHCSSSSSIPEKMNQDQSSSKSSMVSGSPPSEQGGGCSESEDTTPLKKPTKILPCPRCNSADTKFCYFNNYNVNQPRHFCKVCQRYWTAGGSMRNMAVGAGRRKNKNNNSSSNSNSSCVDGNGAVINQDPQNPATVSFQGYAPQYPIWPGPVPCHGFLPVPIYGPTPYWGWNATWMAPASASAELRPLGKHPREESTVLVPKTLRFDDSTEAAKSSIWTTLGNKSQRSGGAFFGGFHPKAEEESSSSTTRLLQANPAALSRYLTFHESAESEIKAGN